MAPIYIALADDEALFRKGMALLIEDFDGMEVLFEATNGKDLLNQLSEQSPLPDVIILDLKMPVLNGIETAKILGAEYPQIHVITLSTYFSKAFVTNMLEIGAAAYLAKNTAPEDVEKTIQTVVEKGFCYTDPVMEIIRENMTGKKQYRKPSFEIKLTNRENEVLQLICEQLTNTEIAGKLFISVRTVDGHRNNLLQKLNCRNTAGLVAYAIQQQLVKIDPSQFWN